MRVVPAALAGKHDMDRVAELAARQAQVTHSHPDAVDGAIAIAVAVALLSHAPVSQFPADVLSPLPGFLQPNALAHRLRTVLAAATAGDTLAVAHRNGNGVAAHESVPTAIAAFLSGPEYFTGTIRAAIGLGGDTDTIAAMAGALAGARRGRTALDEHLLARLEARADLDDLSKILLTSHRTQP